MEWGGMPNSKPLDEPVILFPRIDKPEYFGDAQSGERVQEATERAEDDEEDVMIDIEEFGPLSLRIARGHDFFRMGVASKWLCSVVYERLALQLADLSSFVITRSLS